MRRYVLLCAVLGAVFGWFPRLVHGPIPEKFDPFGIKGTIAVWAFYAARLSIGFVVGIARWPSAWCLRGLLCGLIMMLPVGFFALATPTCGGT